MFVKIPHRQVASIEAEIRRIQTAHVPAAPRASRRPREKRRRQGLSPEQITDRLLASSEPKRRDAGWHRAIEAVRTEEDWKKLARRALDDFDDVRLGVLRRLCKHSFDLMNAGAIADELFRDFCNDVITASYDYLDDVGAPKFSTDPLPQRTAEVLMIAVYVIDTFMSCDKEYFREQVENLRRRFGRGLRNGPRALPQYIETVCERRGLNRSVRHAEKTNRLEAASF